jgi:tetratricopeptide (TPR) repeat protein
MPPVAFTRPFALLFAVSILFGGQPSPAERAIMAAEAVIRKDPGKPDGYNALAMALARRARETADTSFYGKAEAAVEKSLEIAPDNFSALKTRCWIMLGRHEFAGALALAKQLNARMPDDPATYGFLVDAHVELGNYKEAEEAAQWMLDLSRNNVPSLTRAAYLRELFGDVEGALELMRTAYGRIDPAEVEDRAWTLVQIGHLLTLSGRIKAAETVLAEALELVPDYHYGLAALAKAKSAKGDHVESLRLIQRRYEVAPHPENLFDVAVALHQAGKKEAAAKTFARFEKLALAESEGWDNANRELARYYSDYAGKPAEALRIAGREIARRRDIGTIDAYAWALYRSNRLKEARAEIQKVLDAGTVDPKILEHARTIAPKQIISRR